MQVFGDIPFLPGLFVAGVFSGALSSVSSGLNSLAAVTIQVGLDGHQLTLVMSAIPCQYVIGFHPWSLQDQPERQSVLHRHARIGRSLRGPQLHVHLHCQVCAGGATGNKCQIKCASVFT